MTLSCLKKTDWELIVILVTLALLALVMACNQHTESNSDKIAEVIDKAINPEASVDRFTWHFDGEDWEKEKTHVKQALLTLRKVDEALYELDNSKLIGGANFHQAKALLLEVRVHTLMILHNVRPPIYYGENEKENP